MSPFGGGLGKHQNNPACIKLTSKQQQKSVFRRHLCQDMAQVDVAVKTKTNNLQNVDAGHSTQEDGEIRQYI